METRSKKALRIQGTDAESSPRPAKTRRCCSHPDCQDHDNPRNDHSAKSATPKNRKQRGRPRTKPAVPNKKQDKQKSSTQAPSLRTTTIATHITVLPNLTVEIEAETPPPDLLPLADPTHEAANRDARDPPNLSPHNSVPPAIQTQEMSSSHHQNRETISEEIEVVDLETEESPEPSTSVHNDLEFVLNNATSVEPDESNIRIRTPEGPSTLTPAQKKFYPSAFVPVEPSRSTNRTPAPGPSRNFLPNSNSVADQIRNQNHNVSPNRSEQSDHYCSQSASVSPCDFQNCPDCAMISRRNCEQIRSLPPLPPPPLISMYPPSLPLPLHASPRSAPLPLPHPTPPNNPPLPLPKPTPTRRPPSPPPLPPTTQPRLPASLPLPSPPPPLQRRPNIAPPDSLSSNSDDYPEGVTLDIRTYYWPVFRSIRKIGFILNQRPEFGTGLWNAPLREVLQMVGNEHNNMWLPQRIGHEENRPITDVTWSLARQTGDNLNSNTNG